MKSVKRDKLQRISEGDHAEAEAISLRVSFEFIDWETPHLFFIHGLELDHYKKIFDCLARLGASTEAKIIEQTHDNLTSKPIFRNSSGIRKSFPVGLVDKIKAKFKAELASNGDPDENAKKIAATAFEIRIEGKGHGRIHGFVWNKFFHVVWFDPAHNLYPRPGEKPSLHRDYATVAGFSPDDVQALKEENRSLVEENDALRTENEELLEQFVNLPPTGATISSADASAQNGHGKA